ncbi:MAG: InlB B-repeat-containing protein, partial [Clostridiales bacterium]|nr:InlB B-repeat-containing protein [Clostridiales bacterium]
MKKKVLPIVIALLLAVSLLACGGKKGTASVTVTFDTNGGSAVDAQTIDKGAAATVPAEPEKDNFDFVDWFSDAALTAVYDFAAAVDSNITLYAKWEAFDPATATTTWTTLTVSDTTIKITQYTGTARDVIVPAEIDGKAVVSLQINTFRDFVKVTSISIPASVTRLGENGTATQPADVFKGTDKLRAVTVDPENTVYSSCDGIVYSIYDAYKAPTANKQTTMEFIPARVEAVVVPAATKVAGNA